MELDALVIAPHPDDAELGMGGTIARMLAEGMAVGVLDLTDGEPTPRGSPELRAREAAEATAVLGIPWREQAGLPNRSLEATLAARALVAGVIRRTRPRWLFAPHWKDAHPDHLAATAMAEAARFWAKLTKTDLPGEPFHPHRIFYYPCVHLQVVDPPAFVVDVTESWDLKLRSLRCYASQFLPPAGDGPPGVLERVEAAAAWWGASIGCRHGEAFYAREPVGLTGLSQLR